MEEKSIEKKYSELFIRHEEAKKLIQDLIKKYKFKIENDDFIFIFLEQLGDLKAIYNILEGK